MKLNIQIKLPFSTSSTQYNLLLLLPIDHHHRSTSDHRTIPDWTTEVFPRRNGVTYRIYWTFAYWYAKPFRLLCITITLLFTNDRPVLSPKTEKSCWRKSKSQRYSVQPYIMMIRLQSLPLQWMASSSTKDAFTSLVILYVGDLATDKLWLCRL